MEWNVYIYNINHNKIEKYNVLSHWWFVKDIKKIKNKDEFVKKLESELRYYFWSRSEWELIIKITKDNRIFLIPWCGCRNPEEVKIDVTNETNFDWRTFADEHTKKQIYDNEAKIDVFDQVMFNWNLFVEYVWEHRKELLHES